MIYHLKSISECFVLLSIHHISLSSWQLLIIREA
jgi:hypothetical protein